jgi:ATP-binding cassette subfamily F protein uup
VVTSTLVFDGSGRIEEFVGGYRDWLRQRAPDEALSPAVVPGRGRASEAAASSPSPAPGRLTYKEQRELEALPARIEALESERDSLERLASAADFYKEPRDRIEETLARLGSVGTEIEAAYQRWTELESRTSQAPQR